MDTTQELSRRIDATLSSMDERRRRFQEMEARRYEEWNQRLAKLGMEFETLRDILRPRLQLLIEKFGDKITATPKLSQSTREMVLDLHADVARMRLRFQGTTDHEIRKLILTCDLEIIPTLVQIDSHSALVMPLDAIDYEATARWADERIVSFVQTYSALHENPYYLGNQMVEDPISGTRFPKLAAGARLEHGGRIYYFVSEATRREFEREVANHVK